MFTEVRQFLLGKGLRKLATVQTNARGDVTKEFVAVASGGADAYVDVRETLSPENYMAASTPALHAAILEVLDRYAAEG